MSRIFKRAGMATVAVAGALMAGTLPAVADGTTLYSEVPVNGWGHNGTAYAVELTSTAVYVGGKFTLAVKGNNTPQDRVNVMALNRTNGDLLGFVAHTNGTVRSIVVDGQNLYLGGEFTNVNGTPTSRVAKVNLSTGAVNEGPFNVTIGKPVRDMLVIGDKLYIVGDFTNVTGTVRRRAAALNKVTGAVDPTFNPNLNGKTYALALNSSALYLGGNFTTVGPRPRNYLAAVSPSDGAVLPPVFTQLNDVVLDLSVTDAQVFVAAGGGYNSAAAWPVLGGGFTWRLQANGDVQAVKYSKNNVYFGFHDGFMGETNLRLLAADAASGRLERPAFDPVSGGFPGVLALDADDADLVAVGKFPKMGGFNVKGVSIHHT